MDNWKEAIVWMLFSQIVWADGEMGALCVFLYILIIFQKNRNGRLGNTTNCLFYKNQDTIIINTLNILILTAPYVPNMYHSLTVI